MLELPAELLALGTPHTFAQGTHIFYPQQTLNKCYYIINGRVKVYLDHSNGKRSVLDFLGSGDWLGHLSIFVLENQIKQNKVLKEMDCLAFDLAELKKHCRSHANSSFYFSAYMAQKLLERSQRMSEYMNYSLEAKLAQFILKYEDNGIYSIPHTDACEYLNVSYRHVLYTIKKLCEIGVLAKEKHYTIISRSKLTEYAFPDGNQP